MDDEQFEAMIKFFAKDPRKLNWMKGFCAGLESAESSRKEQEAENG